MNTKDLDPYDFSQKEICGVPVYYKNLPWAPCLHIRFSFSTGAFADPEGKEGLAHFLEHIIGNGCPSLPDKKAVKEFSRLYMLNSRNAYTSHYNTYYVGKCLPEHTKTVLEKMSEYVFQPFIRAEDVEHERKVITQEAWRVYRNGKFLNYIKEYSQNLYHGHQRERVYSPLGWPDTVEAITQEDVRSFHMNNYVKENLTIFLVGAVGEKDLETLSEALKNIPSGKQAKISYGQLSKPKKLRSEKGADEIGLPREQVEFSLIRSLEKSGKLTEETLDQSRALLQDVLMEKLRFEHSICYTVNTNLRKYPDFDDLVIAVETGLDKIQLVEKEIWETVDEIIEGKWQDRFNTIHKTIIDQIRSNERTSEAIITNSASELSRNGEITSLEEMLRRVGQVTYKDLTIALKEIFNKDYVFTNVILPSKNN